MSNMGIIFLQAENQYGANVQNGFCRDMSCGKYTSTCGRLKYISVFEWRYLGYGGEGEGEREK